MTDEIPEHELNEWLKTLFFALERMSLPGPSINLLYSESATFPVLHPRILT